VTFGKYIFKENINMPGDFKLDTFIGANADFSRGYTFYATVTGNSMSPNHRYLVKASRLPSSVITPTEVGWQGNKYKIGTVQTFADFTIDYQIDIDDMIRYDYESWVNYIHDPTTNLHGVVGGFSSNYLGEVKLEHVSHTTGNIIMTYILRGAWPSNLGEIVLDYTSTNTATFSVQFTYQYHVIEGITA
jgi:hypothetical protein